MAGTLTPNILQVPASVLLGRTKIIIWGGGLRCEFKGVFTCRCSISIGIIIGFSGQKEGKQGDNRGGIWGK